MLRAVDLVLLAVTAPREALPELRRRQPLGMVLGVLALASFSEALATLLVARATTGAGSGVGFLLWNTFLNGTHLLVAIAAGLIFVPVTARHLVGGRGELGPFFWLLSLSYAPWVLWAGPGMAYQLVPGSSVLWLLTHLALLAWIAALQVAAVGVAFRLTILRAAFALMLGYGLAAVLYVGLAGLAFLGVVNTLVLWAG